MILQGKNISTLTDVKNIINELWNEYVVSDITNKIVMKKYVVDNYIELLKIVSNMNHLDENQTKELIKDIEDKIDRIRHPRHERYNEDLITTEKEFRIAIEEINHLHRFGDNDLKILTMMEAVNLYNILLEVLDKINTIDDDIKKELKREVLLKIGQSQNVEEEKTKEMEDRRNAFIAAKERYKLLSLIEKIKLYREKQTPSHQNLELMSIDEIESLYTVKRK